MFGITRIFPEGTHPGSNQASRNSACRCRDQLELLEPAEYYALMSGSQNPTLHMLNAQVRVSEIVYRNLCWEVTVAHRLADTGISG
jgi:hypothetical protein